MAESRAVPQGSFNRRHDALDATVREVLSVADPLHLIAAGAPDNEYDPEATTIVPRLSDASDVEDVQRIIHEEFARWFTPEIAGPVERYAPAASSVWRTMVLLLEESG